MRNKSRILAWFLAICLCVMSVPFPSCAEETETALEESALDSPEEQEEDGDPAAGRMQGYIPEAFYGTNSRLYSMRSVLRHASKFDGYTVENGIDVSEWNGTIDWTKVKNTGIDFAIIRVAYRGYGSAGNLVTDKYVTANLKGAIEAGIPVGVYIFSQAITEKEAQEEADYILKQISGYNISLPVVIDFEYASDSSGLVGRLYNAKLSKTAATNICMAFCKKVEAAGYTPMVYGNKDMFTNALNVSELSASYPIWLAHYTTATDYDGDYSYWQYGTGTMDGISGSVDMNVRYIKEDADSEETGGSGMAGTGSSGTSAGGSGTTGTGSSETSSGSSGSASSGSTTSSGTTTGSSSGSTTVTTPTYTSYKTTTAVNYRSGPGISYAVKGTLASGKTISVENGYSKSANGYTWYRFKLNSNTYYIASKYLTKVTSTASSGSTTSSGTTAGSSSGSTASTPTYTSYKTTTAVNYRSGPGTSYGVKGTLASGKTISVENGYSKTANGYTWYRFKLNSKTYYIASKYLKKVTGTTSPAGTTSSKTTYTTYKTTTKVNYRSGPGTSYAVKGTLSSGKSVSVENGYSKTANGYKWYRIKLNSKTYYIAAKYLKKG